MFPFLQNFFQGAAGRQANITQNGDVGSPPTSKATNRSKFSLVNMIWYGFFGRFFAPRMLERIEEGKRPLHSSNAPNETKSMEKCHQERQPSTSKTRDDQPGFLTRKWHQWFGTGQNVPITECEMESAQDDLLKVIVHERKTEMPRKETLNEILFHEEIKPTVQNKTTGVELLPKVKYQDSSDSGSQNDSSDQEVKAMNVSQKIALFETMTSNGHLENRRPSLKPNTEIGKFKRSESFVNQLAAGVVKYDPSELPITTVDYVNSFKSVTISIANHTNEFDFQTRNYFTKGCHIKGEILTEVHTLENSTVTFENNLTSAKIALRGVWAIDMHLVHPSTKTNDQATLVIWWMLPVLSTDRFAVGIANGGIDADEKLYKQMKHDRGTWFLKGKAGKKVDKEFPNVHGKYDITVSAQMNSGNSTTYLVEIH